MEYCDRGSLQDAMKQEAFLLSNSTAERQERYPGVTFARSSGAQSAVCLHTLSDLV